MTPASAVASRVDNIIIVVIAVILLALGVALAFAVTAIICMRRQSFVVDWTHVDRKCAATVVSRTALPNFDVAASPARVVTDANITVTADDEADSTTTTVL